MAGVHRFSTQEIMSISRAWFSNISSEKLIDLSTIQNLFDASQIGLSCEEIKDLELALLLVASAHKVGNKQFGEATKFLNVSHFLSSSQGNSVQRVVHYFTKALLQRIAQETETVSLKGSDGKGRTLLYPAEMAKGVNPALISCCLQLPSLQAVHFAGIQAVIDGIQSARKVHFIDLGIKTGSHCTLLMQALANRQECPVDLLKITGVGITKSRQRIEDAGKSLGCFAESLDLPFSFNTLTVTNIKDIKEEMFEQSDGEVVAIFLPGILRIIKAQEDSLQCLLRVLRKLNPGVMVIIEPELNHSSPIFIEKFLELLLYYSTCYDGIEGCINQSDPNRISVEECMGDEIRDLIAAEDDQMIVQHMKIDEWRDCLTSFGMVEMEISMASFFQAELMLKNFASGKSCLLVRNEKCLLTGWKGTPLISVSAWQFQQEQPKRNQDTTKCDFDHHIFIFSNISIGGHS